MQYCFYLLFNIVLTAMLFYTIYDSTKDYILAQTNALCIDDDRLTKKFCAQCGQRNNEQLSHKGFIVQGEEKLSILKIILNSSQLDCQDYLQLPNFQKMKDFNTPLQIQNVKAIEQIIEEVEGVLAVTVQKTEIISSEYNAFVIYRWFGPTQEKKSHAKYPNATQIQTIQHFFLYVINAAILLFIVLYYYNKSTYSHLKPKILIFTSIYFMLVQVLTLNLTANDTILQFARIVFLAIILMRIDTNKMIIVLSLLIGIISRLYPILYLPYLLFVILSLFVRGYNEQNTKEIWSYMIYSLCLYTANQIWWNYKFAELADNHCRLIELAFLTLTPLGLMLIKDAKYVGFDIYKPNQLKKHSISLSGFEEEEDDEEN